MVICIASPCHLCKILLVTKHAAEKAKYNAKLIPGAKSQFKIEHCRALVQAAIIDHASCS